MHKRSRFLRWALYTSLLSIGGFIAARLGWARFVWNDSTHLNLLTLGVFAWSMLWFGRLCWRFDGGMDPDEVEHAAGNGWFAAEICVVIGMLGTVIGYYLQAQVRSAGETASGDFIELIRHAMSTCLINTAIGGICSLFLLLPTHFIAQGAKHGILQAKKQAEKAALEQMTLETATAIVKAAELRKEPVS